MRNILFCGNSKVFDGVLTCMLSVLKRTHATDPFCFYIFTMDMTRIRPEYTPISEDMTNFLERVAKKFHPQNRVISVDVTVLYERYFGGCPNESAYCSPYTLLRLLADLVPGMPDKLLYLDADILFQRDIRLLYDKDVSHVEYAAARDHYGKYLISPDYINAGVLLLNMKNIRRTGLFMKARKLLQTKKLIFADQSAIIRSTRAKMLLPQKFNDQKFLHKHTVVRHFSRRLFYLPYPHTDNIKQWEVERVHTVFHYHAFDDILKEVCMVFFFTSVGFQANLKVLKSGGKSLIIFLILVIVLIICQNFLAVGLSKALQISPLVGLCTGSIPMIGGHGTAGAFGPVLEDFGVKGASTLCTAAATFGLIAGSIMGGPVGKRLIEKKNLLKTAIPEDNSLLIEEEKKHERHTSMYPAAVFQLIIAMGIGTIISKLLSMTGMTFPIYIGAMIAAAFMRNIGEYSGQFTIYMGEINDIGGISLSLFLGIAMITLKLWQLADLALPLITLLAGQTILMFLFTYFVVFNIMGRDYDAAVLSSGVCGFGMGATPNAMANMQAICERYVPSVKAYLLVPLIGSLFADFLNSLVITFFINFL